MKQLVDGVIETVITDEALHLAHDAAEQYEILTHTAITKDSIMMAYAKAKEASIAQNARSCRIVTEQRERRGHTSIDEGISTSFEQKSIYDYVSIGRE